MKKIILADRNAYHDTIAEEKYLFLKEILIAMGLPDVDECMPDNYKEQTVQQKIAMKSLIRKFDLYVKEPSLDTMDILLDGKSIASFNKPFSFLKEDPQELDSSKRIYLKIELDLNHPFKE